MSTTDADKALLGIPPVADLPGSQLIVRVARDVGLSPVKQFREMIALRLGEPKLALAEYYKNRVYRTNLSKDEKRTFVGDRSNRALNTALSPEHACKMRGLLNNKVMYGATLTQLGLATTHTQALTAHEGSVGNIPVLRSAEDIARFLREEADYPVFGKPRKGSQSVGSASIVGYDAKTDMVRLGNGSEYACEQLSREMWEDYPQGYIFQSAIRQHPDMTEMAGKATGSVRIVTVNDGTGAKVLYSAWKMPSPKAMSDNFWQAGSMLAALDIDTGTVIRVVRGGGPDREEIKTHPVSGKTCEGFQIPHWDAAKALACEAHDLFPEHGVFGFDMAIGEDGPLVIECNANPAHGIYQTAFGEGVKNARFMAIFQPIIDKHKANDPKVLRRAERKAAKAARKAG